MINNNGPNTDPCGTPLVTHPQSDFLPLICTLCFLQFSHSPIHLSTFPYPRKQLKDKITVDKKKSCYSLFLIERQSIRKINFGGRGVLTLPSWRHSSRRQEEIQRQEECSSEFTSDREERVKVLVHSRIRGLDSIGVSLCRKTCTARPWEEGRQAVSKFKRAVSMKIAIEDWERSNTAARI